MPTKTFWIAHRWFVLAVLFLAVNAMAVLRLFLAPTPDLLRRDRVRVVSFAPGESSLASTCLGIKLGALTAATAPVVAFRNDRRSRVEVIRFILCSSYVEGVLFGYFIWRTAYPASSP